NSSIIDIIEHIQINAKRVTEHSSLVKEQINLAEETIVTIPWVNSFLMERLEYPIANETDFSLQKNETLTIICNETDFPRVGMIASMREKGVIVETISWENCENKSAGAGSLLMILPKSEQPFYNQSEDDFYNRSQALLKNVFTVVRNRLDKSGSFPDGFCCLIVDFYSNDKFDSNESTAFHAFLKSLKLEHKEVRFKMLSIPEGADDTDSIILTELEHFSERIRIEYTAGKRFTWVAAPITEEGKEILKLDAEDVVIVSGGAKGITFEHALALGREYGVKLALLGTSPQPLDNDNSSELSLNLKRLEKENITYLYLQCDVTDPDSVQQAFRKAESKLGHITGIFHGAGISKFNLFREKSFEEFFECFRVKAFGLFNLIKACKPEKLKMLHVISSVLGHTGMRSQCDYTFANAWLDEAVWSFSVKFPAIHCLTLGYTVWGEAGLGKKLGALDYLKTVGVHALKIEDGIGSYLNILKKVNRKGAYVITGRLANDLEANLFAPLSKIKGRFLERILRYVPQTEIATEFPLSHETDLYLQEHIYNGTPVMPAVMEIEAMVQAVLQCRGTFELPVLKNIRFITPIIVPKGEQVKVRVIAAAKYQPGETPYYGIQVKASTNDFSQNYIEADCFFEKDVQLSDGLPSCPVLVESLPLNPDELSPYPLFQGKLFRRIEKIYRQDFEKDCITTIKVPDGEQYFADGLDNEIYFGSPAVRDSAYQSGLLIVSEGSLPDVIQEIRLYKNMEPGNILVFNVHELVKKNTLEYDVSFTVFNQNQELVTFEKISLKKPESGSPQAPVRKIKPISIDRIENDLQSLLPDGKHAIAIVSMKSLNDCIENGELTKEEVAQIKQSCSNARLTSTLANLVAMRRAAIKFTSKYGKHPLTPKDINIAHQKDGKPLLEIAATYPDKAIFADMDISITDGGGYSIAFIGPGKVGVDIEP
ncbi:MAG: SDR family NAD(P)-dependent oxidoreductase, partial [Bacteroidota bacterium]